MGPKHVLCYVLLCIIGVSCYNPDEHEHYVCQSDETCAHLFRNPLSKCLEHYCFSESSDIYCKKDYDCPVDNFCEEGSCRHIYCKDVYDCPRNNRKNLYASEIHHFIIKCDINNKICSKKLKGHKSCARDTFVCDEHFDKKCMSNIFKCDGDQDCEDGSDESKCAKDGHWTSWGRCTKSCQGGKQKRTCTNPPPSYGGRRCYGRKIKHCNGNINCAVNGGWTPWGSCSKSCIGGDQKRMCTNPLPSYGGRECYGRSIQECNSNINCAVDGGWTSWGSCSKSCKVGEQKRTCTNPSPSSAGRGCYGSNTQQCKGINKCALNGCNNPGPSDGWRTCEDGRQEGGMQLKKGGVASMSSIGCVHSLSPRFRGGIADNCVDGDLKTFCHSYGNTKYPYLMIEYPKPVLVKAVDIVVRSDCCGNRVKQLVVTITNCPPMPGMLVSGGDIIGSFPGPAHNGQKLNFESSAGIRGKYVVVQQGYISTLNLAELYIRLG